MARFLEAAIDQLIVGGFFLFGIGLWVVYFIARRFPAGTTTREIYRQLRRSWLILSVCIAGIAGFALSIVAGMSALHLRVLPVDPLWILWAIVVTIFVQISAWRVSFMVRLALLAASVLSVVGAFFSLRLGHPLNSVHLIAAILAFAVSARSKILELFLQKRFSFPLVTLASIGGIAAPLFIGTASADDAQIEVVLPVIGSVQPQEMGRVFLVLSLALLLDAARPMLITENLRLRGVRVLNIPLVFVSVGPALIAVALGAVSSDLGPAFLIVAVTIVMMWIAGARRIYFFLALVSASVGVLLASYFSEKAAWRIHLMLHPIQPKGVGLEPIAQAHSQIAHGGFEGLGVGRGLPVRTALYQSDFILSSIAEELGMVTVLIVMSLLTLIGVVSFQVAKCGDDGRSTLAAVGLGSLLTLPVVLMAGGVFAILPHSGMAIPFLALSGSSIVSSAFALGLLTAISRQPTVVGSPTYYGKRLSIAVSLITVTASMMALAGLRIGTGFAGTLEQIGPDRDTYQMRLQLVNRGEIRTRDGKVIARTVSDDPEKPLRLALAIRDYPEERKYSKVVGHVSLGGIDTGLEGVLNERLACPDTDRFTGIGCPSVTLTVDSRVQDVAYRSLEGYTGAALAVDTRSGNVLAYISAPYDHEEDYVVAATTAPGSVAKLGTALIASELDIPLLSSPAATYTVEEGVVPSFDQHPCGGNSLVDAIATSCNPEFASLGEKIGAERLSVLGEKLYNQQSEINDIPIAHSSLARPDDSAFMTAIAAIGQGNAQITPFAVNQLTVTIARDGQALPFTFIEGDVPDRLPEDIDAGVVEEVQEGMRMAVLEGTASTIPGLAELRAAAKTGTAERGDSGFTNSWFTVYAPYDSPRCAVTVALQPGDAETMGLVGAEHAGPAAAKILEACLKAD